MGEHAIPESRTLERSDSLYLGSVFQPVDAAKCGKNGLWNPRIPTQGSAMQNWFSGGASWASSGGALLIGRVKGVLQDPTKLFESPVHSRGSLHHLNRRIERVNFSVKELCVGKDESAGSGEG